MVLSNKKLKQRLREELLTKSVGEPESNTNSDANSQSQSLKVLLDSVSQKPRLSKREKRRKAQPLQGIEGLSLKSDEIEEKKESEKKKKVKKKSNEVEEKEDAEVNDGDGGEIKKEKKRKRKTEEGVEDGAVKEAKTPKKNKKKKKKKKGKKKKEEGAAAPVEEAAMEIDAGIESQVIEDVSRKVYVGGIPYSYTEEDISHYFEGCGAITEIDCMNFPDTGKFRGIAFITFETEDAAKHALELDRAEMGGLQLTIQPYKSTKTTRATKDPNFAPKMVEGYNRIYAGNLSWDITEDDLKKLFSDCTISSIRFGTNKETGEFRGFAHVDFADSVSVAMALKLDQEIVCGRPVKISCAVPEIKAGKKFSKPKPPIAPVPTAPVPLPTAPVAVVQEVSVEGVSSGKIRRRTCYECGEKGHISSACPKVKNADATKSSAA